MPNTSSSSSFKLRSQTAPVTKTAHKLHIQQKRVRSGSLPIKEHRYVPVFYKNPDPELTIKLKSFLLKAPLNSAEDLRLKSASKISRSRSATPDMSRSYFRNASYYVSDRFSHLLPEKRTIQQLVLPPVHLGCKENFNQKYDRENRIGDELDTTDLSVQMEQLKYCRYLRVYEHTKERIPLRRSFKD